MHSEVQDRAHRAYIYICLLRTRGLVHARFAVILSYMLLPAKQFGILEFADALSCTARPLPRGLSSGRYAVDPAPLLRVRGLEAKRVLARPCSHAFFGNGVHM